jgi:hypothetical protein
VRDYKECYSTQVLGKSGRKPKMSIRGSRRRDKGITIIMEEKKGIGRGAHRTLGSII